MNTMNQLRRLKHFKKNQFLLVATFAAFLTPFLGSAVNLALPSIGKDLNANAISLGWVISSFILSSAIFLLPFGRLADIIGRKKIFSMGILLFTISTFLIIFSRSITSLIILKDIPGIIKCNDIWNKSCNNNFCFSARGEGKSNGNQYNCSISWTFTVDLLSEDYLPSILDGGVFLHFLFLLELFHLFL